MLGRVDAEVPPLILVQQTAEHRGRVELGPGGVLGWVLMA